MKLPYDFATACQIQVTKNRSPNMRETARRPNIFENGITMKLENPSTITVIPVMSGVCVSDKENVSAKRGNIGDMASADVVAINVYSASETQASAE